jgi:hypothetical protein
MITPRKRSDSFPTIKEAVQNVSSVFGFDDSQVTETIEYLRELRGKQREEAEKAKSEQKAAAQKKEK